MWHPFLLFAGGRCPMMNGLSSSASTVSQKCPVGTVVTSGRGGPRWPWLVSGLQLSLLALGCLAGQRDGVVGEIQRRRTAPPRLGRRRGVAAARRLAQVSGQLSEGETAGRFEVELAALGWRFWGAREAWGRVGGLGVGSGFLGWGAAAAAAAGQAIFLRWLSVVGALELSVWDGFDGPPGEVGRFRHGFWSERACRDHAQVLTAEALARRPHKL